MNKVDRRYLHLQYWLKVLDKDGIEFQSFFIDFMQAIHPNFESVKPYGNLGDRKNDGFMKDEGKYYQVYSPENPLEKQSTAAKKMIVDFKGLFAYWNNLFPIKEFNFVFNDKKNGIAPPLYKALAYLGKTFPAIKFDILTPIKLEDLVLSLIEDKLIQIGFDVDSRKSAIIINNFIEILETELDKGNGAYVLKLIEAFNFNSTFDLEDQINLELEIIEGRALSLSEKISEAIKFQEQISSKYPEDIRPVLYQAELYLNSDRLEDNLKLLNLAKSIDSGHWFYEVEILIRKYRLREQVDLAAIDEDDFPSDNRVRSIYYRLYSLFYFLDKNEKKALQFIDKAIRYNPNKISNYLIKLEVLDQLRHFNKSPEANDSFTKYFEYVETKLIEFNNSNPKIKLRLNCFKLEGLIEGEEAEAVDKLASETIGLVKKLYFDIEVDHLISFLFLYLRYPEDAFQETLEYLSNTEKQISERLGNSLVLQFAGRDELLTKGKEYFISLRDKGPKKILQFIDDIENSRFSQILEYLKAEKSFLSLFVLIFKEKDDLLSWLIENIPTDDLPDKPQIKLINHYHSGDLDNAYNYLLSIDISAANYAACKIYQKIARHENDNALEIGILKRIINLGKRPKEKTYFQLLLLDLLYKEKAYPELFELGEELLIKFDEIGSQNKETFLIFLLRGYIERGDIEGAKKVCDKIATHINTFNLKLIEADLYIKEKKGLEALTALVEGIKLLGHPTDEDYAHLVYPIILIGNLLNRELKSNDSVSIDSFVKIHSQNKWYYVGEGTELDATKIHKGNPHYDYFINKPLGEILTFPGDKYSGVNERKIELIYDIEDYIIWQINNKFQEYAQEGRLPGVQVVKILKEDGQLDIKMLESFFADQYKGKEEIFNSYCQSPTPLAFLAYSEGGLSYAMGKIIGENKGFIRGMNGSREELEKQKETAQRVIEGQEIVLDGTSCLFLLEAGLLDLVFQNIPNLKYPHSLIKYLTELTGKFEIATGQVGTMGYIGEKVVYHPIQEDKMQQNKVKIKKAIEALERNKEREVYLSNSVISDKFTESKIYPELRDACVIAQVNGLLILTDDFLYLHANSIDTGKKIPEYISSISLIRKLFDSQKISFGTYLDYFYFLSNYRYNFLPITVEDLEKAIFGEGSLFIIQTDNLKKFNFKLTLSKEYGVEEKTAVGVLTQFLTKLILDNTIPIETVKKIYSELYFEFFKFNPFSSLMVLRFCEIEILKLERSKVIKDTGEWKTRLQELKGMAEILLI